MQGQFVWNPDTLREIRLKTSYLLFHIFSNFVQSDLSETLYGSQLAKSSKPEASSSPLPRMTDSSLLDITKTSRCLCIKEAPNEKWCNDIIGHNF